MRNLEKIDLSRLMKLRLVVARHGERDRQNWWNTEGLLGPRGSIVLRRGFSKTHRFAQARIVFEVARSRCREVFSAPGCLTLWSVPAEVEARFDEEWHEWLDDLESWRAIFEAIESPGQQSLIDNMRELNLIEAPLVEEVSKLRRSAEGRAVALSGRHQADDQTLARLAAAFDRGEPGRLAVPYARLADSA